ncbi:hypothetical protein [Paenibacillus whitsoniae]|uniref:Uncharacterized protein n=1 Tax=Paenibacillus whitsoniae TaxID=2496558 RepID=A0A3S0A6P6_9BACL|nr:hypothetical protein [Paenibacillus whitsoniae]RTE02097.1 hypothetical protein EJQ19_29845 [Paenibacillus whitsoniae]
MSGRRRAQIELHLLISLARSQRALSRMLEAAADQVEASGDLAQHIGENLGAIAAHQRALLQRVTGLPVRVRSHSAPGKPWVNAQLRAGAKRPPAKQERRTR